MRLDAVLRIQIAEVFRLTRLIESKTGYVSEIGRHNLNDAFAHLSVLADPALTSVQQASQLSKIEEHLRRVIVEHPEEVVRDRLGTSGSCGANTSASVTPIARLVRSEPLHVMKRLRIYASGSLFTSKTPVALNPQSLHGTRP